MYSEKHSQAAFDPFQNAAPQSRQRSKGSSAKARIIVIALVLVTLFTVVGTTVAYLIETTSMVKNTFSAAEESIPVIIEDFDDGDVVKKNVNVKLEGGNGNYYVRAAVVFTLQDEDGNTVAQLPAEGVDYSVVWGSKWKRNTADGYWYYTETVAADHSTSDLIVSCTTLKAHNDVPEKDCKLVVDVAAQTIQANPVSAVQDEWGYTPPVSKKK